MRVLFSYLLQLGLRDKITLHEIPFPAALSLTSISIYIFSIYRKCDFTLLHDHKGKCWSRYGNWLHLHRSHHFGRFILQLHHRHRRWSWWRLSSPPYALWSLHRHHFGRYPGQAQRGPRNHHFCHFRASLHSLISLLVKLYRHQSP